MATAKQDLTELFRAGLATAAGWSQDDVRQALDALALQRPGARVDWEPGDEQWGRVVGADGDVVGLVCARVAVGAVRQTPATAALPQGVAWLRFRSMDEPHYQVARDVLEAVFERPVSSNVNCASLSLGDLWWATVS